MALEMGAYEVTCFLAAFNVGCVCLREDDAVTPIFRARGYRFYFFFSREEPRTHVHVHHETGEAKFWLDPEIGIVENDRLSPGHFGG